MKTIKSLELIALENLIPNPLENINRGLHIVTLNNLLEVQELQPKQREVEQTKDKVYFGIIGKHLFKLWADSLECAFHFVEEMVTLNSALSEELEISHEQVKSLKQELVAESQKVGFWQEEAEACNKEIEALNRELQNYYQFHESDR